MEEASIVELFSEALQLPTQAIAYRMGRTLAERLPEHAVIEGELAHFDVEEFAEAGLCTLELLRSPHGEVHTAWRGAGEPVAQSAANAWYRANWNGHALGVLLATWPEARGNHKHYWVVAESRTVAEQFYAEVCAWNAEVRDEVLVFSGGCWRKSGALHQAIRDATFENLILPPALKQEIRDDLRAFFEARPTYEHYGVPWKRGVLLLGPPGNGKTHTVKALINDLGQPCLYVSSFKAIYGPDDANIRAVFARARESAPCVLVLEDLDALVHDRNRSVFLNELDGFAANTGILTVATTNHPERLDPAILERPSRFDRKYFFGLPAIAERRAYLRLWNDRFHAEMRLPEEAIEELAALTEEFSFAYLKELIVSSTVRWIDQLGRARMDATLLELVPPLREQMRTGADAAGAQTPAREDAEEDE